MRKRLIIIFLFIGYLLTALMAQDSKPAAGGVASGSGGTMSYSVGQLVYTSNIGSGGAVTQGVQQSYEIWVLTETEKAKLITLSVSAYPNPTSDFLKLHIQNSDLKELSYQLTDISGKTLENKIVTDSETSIDLHKLVPASYFLNVISGKTAVKTFKIIKN
jgi:hypothetical protein